MEIVLKPVCSRRDLKTFIHLPARIHRDHKNWVPPLYSDEYQFFSAKKNKSFQYCDVILLMAYRGKLPVGRIMGIINHKYNALREEKNGRFNFLEAWDDTQVIEALIGAVEKWARSKGMEKLVGPLAFSDKDPQGYLIKGLDEPTVIASHCNFEYLVKHLDALGFEKDLDLVVYKINIPDQAPGLYKKIAERAMKNNPGIKLIEFTRRKELKPLVRPIFTLINETFTRIYGFMPFTLEEMDDFANRYLLIMDPRYIKAMANEKDEIVGFVIAMPDISKGIKKSRGYLFPFGFFQILLAGRRTRQLNLLLGAIRPDYQNRGLDTIMGLAMLESAHKGGLDHIDSHLQMETNFKVRAEMEYMGGQVYKTFRIFARQIEKIESISPEGHDEVLADVECG
jgi:ribosomal protein S18 acetylase RimI-like enzyme